MTKPILCLDFDGVLNSYKSGWGDGTIVDPPTAGTFNFLERAFEDFEVHVFSSRSGSRQGIEMMAQWLFRHAMEHYAEEEAARRVVEQIRWATHKPPAAVFLDDRAVTFTGVWPTVEALKAFRCWIGR